MNPCYTDLALDLGAGERLPDPPRPPKMERCNLCTGRGYRIRAPKGSGKGRRTLSYNCLRCGGRGEVLVGTRNADPHVK